ncbi:MAG: histidine kinase [Deltaproteobacteria bacterium RBG_13_49_15]|nr:MAG: histidine kinase [Deltaproteobacteria bacterium RBG_13_49_15]
MGERILLVDDEEGIRTVLRISLSDRGYEVFTAENGEQALDIFREKSPSIVLTDIKMPGMDGLQLLEVIKRESPDTEVIMITGHGDMDLAIKSLKHQATDFITKPINDDILEIALNRARERMFMRNQLRAYTENLENLVLEKSQRLVELERQMAVGQAVEGLSAAIRDIAGDLDQGATGIRYFNEMPCYVSIHNRDLKIIAINQLYTKRLGGLVGGDSWQIYKRPLHQVQDCPANKTFQSGTGQRSREVVRYQTGEEVPVIVHTAPIRNSKSQVELVLEIAADVTEIERLQEELRTTRQHYQQLFDEVPCYISVQDREFRMTAVNRRFKEDFGETIGTHCYEAYKFRSEPCNECPVARTFEDGKSHHSEMTVVSKTGKKYTVLVWTAPIRNTYGDIIQVMEMMTNITEIRQLQDHLSTLGLLIGSLSHGIKGLLTGLDGGMYLLGSGFARENEEQIKRGWDSVKLMVERIRRMVLDILYYAKKRELQLEKVDIFSFAGELAMTMEQKAGSHGIRFVNELNPVLGEFEVDAGAVRSALINILENALDACLEDKQKDDHQITFNVMDNEDSILFEVTDNGIGMDIETKENLFTLFFSTKGKSGTGLGLFISNKVVEQHGGRIEVQSEPRKGTQFRIRMPKRLPDSAKSTKSR